MRTQIYQAPWFKREPDGQLRRYGPRSPEAYAKAHKRWSNWAWQPDRQRPAEIQLMVDYMRGPDNELRRGVPQSEVSAYLLVCEQGKSVRAAAKELGIERGSLRSYLKRLRNRAKTAIDEADGAGQSD